MGLACKLDHRSPCSSVASDLHSIKAEEHHVSSTRLCSYFMCSSADVCVLVRAPRSTYLYTYTSMQLVGTKYILKQHRFLLPLCIEFFRKMNLSFASTQVHILGVQFQGKNSLSDFCILLLLACQNTMRKRPHDSNHLVKREHLFSSVKRSFPTTKPHF
jgi:hypothetical protein